MNKTDIINRSERDDRILVRKSPSAKNAHSASEDDGGRLLSADYSEGFFNKSGMLTSAIKNTHFFLDLFLDSGLG